ncbi:methyltransferase domain-containing protein [Rickettsiales endosymbiont of Peranema trichophorum]|uniref:methyltransferase domain-containing protein n=1 Tax=Rickettsiales endosymbiont of Peranema trichophorum TaxID=2486577 RepID=UPI001023020F|nr:methyltransferase domain-containing protein [Rickettsiales endosymbiont of Peranema trichophorum]RZI47326.1 methyltransferase domain-containing protein [Rickettsiales endosymbiont of Peranema trichophorum]
MKLLEMIRNARLYCMEMIATVGVKGILVKGWNESVASLRLLASKAMNLPQTNLDLAKYHYLNNNIWDAICRLKMVMFFEPTQYPEINYYLGRCYYESSKYTKAKVYLDRYLESSHGVFVTEAQFMLAVITGAVGQITAIPHTFIKISGRRLAAIYTKRVGDGEEKGPEFEIVKCVESFMLLRQYLKEIDQPQGHEVLDIGCGIGTVGELCRTYDIANTVTGVDLSEGMIAIAAGLSLYVAGHGKVAVYDQARVMDVYQYFQEFSSLHKFNMLIAFNFLGTTLDLQHFFKGCSGIAEDDAVLAVTFVEDMESNFSPVLKKFKYSVQDVKDSATQNGWSAVREHGMAERLKLMIFRRSQATNKSS